MQPKDFNTLFSALSNPRVNAYKYYFGQNLSDDQVFGCYQWNESVSHSFFKLITLIEIVMRNRMHSALSQHYFSHNKEIIANCNLPPWQWQTSNYSTIGNQSSCNWYNSTNNGNRILNNKSLGNIHSITHNRRSGAPWGNARLPSADDVVSSLTFGFWSSLVDKCPNVAWSSILSDIYPKHRTSNSNQWNSDIEQKKLSYRLELVRDFRNRIAHHEPIWKFGDYLSEQPPVTNGQLDLAQPRAILDSGTTTPQQSIRRLRSIYSKHTQLLRWMSKEIHDDFVQSTLHKQILWLCSEDGLNAHVNREGHTSMSMKPCRFKRELSSILRSKKPTYLHKKGRNLVAIQHIS